MQGDSKLYSSGGTAFLSSEALEELRSDTALSELVKAMRKKEACFVRQLNDVDAACVRLTCQREIASLLEDGGMEEAITAVDPSAFARTVCSLRGALAMARKRRYAREVAKIYEHVCTNALFVPQCLEDYHRLWELAMSCEPRWNESFPTSAFRIGYSRVHSMHEGRDISQINTSPERIKTELCELLGFLGDTTVLLEARAIASYASLEFTHPFDDGNGHTGRTLLIALLTEGYSLPTIVRFACTVTTNRQLGQLLIPLREKKLGIADYCLEVLGWLYEAQPETPVGFVASAS